MKVSWEVAEEGSRKGWDVTWVWREVFKGQNERKKIRLFVVVVVTSLSLLPAVLKVTWYLEEYNSSQEVYQRAKQYLGLR